MRRRGGGVKLVRGFAVLLSYLLGVSAIFAIGIIGLMALQSSTKPTPSAPVATSQKIAKPVKHTTDAQKEAQPTQKRKAAHVTHKRKEEAPTFSSSSSGYGYAAEPRRFYQYPPLFFGR